MLKQFLEIHPFSRRIGDFTTEQFALYNGKMPESHIQFLLDEGMSVFGSDFFWTVYPGDYHKVLSRWGLDGANCYAFLRSSFGCIAYSFENDIYALNVQTGFYSIVGDEDLDYLFNTGLYFDTILDEYFCFDLHKANLGKLPVLKSNEIFSLEMPMAKGGEYNGAIKVAKMKEELIYLADEFGNKVTE